MPEYCPGICLERLRGSRGIVCVSTGIRTRYHPNASHNRYSVNTIVDKNVVFKRTIQQTLSMCHERLQKF
jgi:hypothetical protein